MAEPSNGVKAFTGIAVLAAILGGMAGIVRPMQHEIDNLEKQIDLLRIRTEKPNPRLDRAESDIHELQTWKSNYESRVRELDAAQWERIKSLERKTFGMVSE